jgi:hypothetical protein
MLIIRRLLPVILTCFATFGAASASDGVLCDVVNESYEEEFYSCNLPSATEISSPDTKLLNPVSNHINLFRCGQDGKNIKHLPVDFVDSFPNLLVIICFNTSIER